MGWTPLSVAAFAGHLDVVSRLLDRQELDVNLVDQDRQTPLFHAISAGRLDVATRLLADPRTNSAISNRPLRHTARDIAFALGHAAVVEQIDQRRNRDIDRLSPLDSYTEPAAPAERSGGLDESAPS